MPIKPTKQQVERFLSDNFTRDISEVSYLDKQGEWSQAFSFLQDNKPFIIRFSGFQDDFLKDKIAYDFNSNYLPIPRLTSNGQALSGYYAISERVFGEVLEELNSEKMHNIIPAVFDMLDEGRMANLSSSSGYGSWDSLRDAPYKSWSEFLLAVKNDRPDGRISGWRESMINSPFGDSAFNAAFEQLEKLVKECPEDRSLIHSDLLHKNVFVKDNKIAGVIDWGNAMYGDFLYDLATFTFYSPWYPAMKSIDWTTEIVRYCENREVSLPKARERIRCYELHIGLATQTYNAFIKRWDFLGETAKRTTDLANHD